MVAIIIDATLGSIMIYYGADKWLIKIDKVDPEKVDAIPIKIGNGKENVESENDDTNKK